MNNWPLYSIDDITTILTYQDSFATISSSTIILLNHIWICPPPHVEWRHANILTSCSQRWRRSPHDADDQHWRNDQRWLHCHRGWAGVGDCSSQFLDQSDHSARVRGRKAGAWCRSWRWTILYLERRVGSILPIFLWYEEWWWVRLSSACDDDEQYSMHLSAHHHHDIWYLSFFAVVDEPQHSTLGDQNSFFVHQSTDENGNSGRGAEIYHLDRNLYL